MRKMVLFLAMLLLVLSACQPVETDPTTTEEQQTTSTSVQFVESDKAQLTIPGDLTNVEGALNLPTKGEHGSVISWESSDEAVISNEGWVYPSLFEEKTVELTATIAHGETSDEKSFEVTVKPTKYLFMEKLGNHSFNDLYVRGNPGGWGSPEYLTSQLKAYLLEDGGMMLLTERQLTVYHADRTIKWQWDFFRDDNGQLFRLTEDRYIIINNGIIKLFDLESVVHWTKEIGKIPYWQTIHIAEDGRIYYQCSTELIFVFTASGDFSHEIEGDGLSLITFTDDLVVAHSFSDASQAIFYDKDGEETIRYPYQTLVMVEDDFYTLHNKVVKVYDRNGTVTSTFQGMETLHSDSLSIAKHGHVMVGFTRVLNKKHLASFNEQGEIIDQAKTPHTVLKSELLLDGGYTLYKLAEYDYVWNKFTLVLFNKQGEIQFEKEIEYDILDKAFVLNGYLYLVGDVGILRKWDIETGEEVLRFEHKDGKIQVHDIELTVNHQLFILYKEPARTSSQGHYLGLLNEQFEVIKRIEYRTNSSEKVYLLKDGYMVVYRESFMNPQLFVLDPHFNEMLIGRVIFEPADSYRYEFYVQKKVGEEVTKVVVNPRGNHPNKVR